MCGIAGIVVNNPTEQPSSRILEQMIQIIKHRGPDAQQIWVQNQIGFAHARLSIIDLDASANQPMHDRSTGNVVVFNGEIYNYLELKAELIQKGYQFQTKSDTEVILHAYACWGVECLNRFNGMWAIALYDMKNQQLFCARDRVGIKPFVYGITEKNDLVFASEIKAIAKTFPEFNQVNEPFLIDFIERDFFACYKETFYKKIFNLLPGHYFVVKAGEIPQQKRFWNWTPQLSTERLKDKEVAEQFRYLLTDSIQLRFRSDVPVGTCLSGGMDSGSIVGLASQLFQQPLHTFSCIYPSTPAFDESSYIHDSVTKFNSISRLVEPKHDDFIQLIKDSTYEQDGPTGGPSILSQRSVMELAGQHVKVVLDGQGADELLGGYHGYFPYSLRSISRKKNVLKLWDFYSSAAKIQKRTGIKNSYKDIAQTIMNPVSFTTQNRSETQLHYFDEFQNDDLNTLLLEHVFTNLSNLLHYEDRNSMRFSVESRLPFLDYRLIEFAFSLPAKYKIRGSTTKWLLQSVARDVLPQSILNRKDKMGYSTPAHHWFLQNDNIRYFERFVNDTNPLFSSLNDYMRNHFLTSYQNLLQLKPSEMPSNVDMNGLWRLFTASMWREQMTC